MNSSTIVTASRRSTATYLQLLQTMSLAREIDRLEDLMVSQGQGFFSVSGAGHELIAVAQNYLVASDYLHLHYRDKALLLARGVTAQEVLASFLTRDGTHSRGRQMSAHFSSKAHRILSMVGPVGNNALQAVGVAAAIRNSADLPIVLCSVGDGTTQQGEFLEALAEAARSSVPVLFVIEDNQYAISTRTTGQTCFQPANRERCHSWLGIPVTYADGAHIASFEPAIANAIAHVRRSRGPAILVMEVARLSNHTNADDQLRYRDEAEVARAWLDKEPIENLRQLLRNQGCSAEQLDEVQARAIAQARDAMHMALSMPKPRAMLHAKANADAWSRDEYRGPATADTASTHWTMREALNGVLRHHLQCDARFFLYGQDIEDAKGDVFGVTRGMIDTEQSIRVPLFGSGSISMRGDRVYKHAVRTMLQLTERVCQQQQLGLNDLACIVPHQANGRILQYLETATCRPVVRNIEQFGNTSSSTIPMALVQSAQQSLHADRGWRALVTFAGGFISGACLGRLS